MFDFDDKSDDQIVKMVLGHFGHAKQKRLVYEPLWETLNKIFMPRRYDFLQNDRRGKQYGAKVYSGHPAIALNKCALGTLNYLASKSTPWLAFGASNQRTMANDEVKRYFQECAEQVLWSFNKSSFFSSSIWFTKDGFCTGTAASVPEHDYVRDRVVYKTMHPSQCYVEDDEFGNPCALFRPFKRTAIQLYQLAGKDKLPDEIVAAAEGRDGAKNPFSEFDVLMAVYRNHKYSTSDDSLLPEDGPNKIFYILMGTKEKNKQLIVKSGIDYFPLIWRMGKEPDYSYGTSLAADALTFALIDNKLAEKGLQAVHMAIEPPTIAPASLRGRVRLNPGGRTWTNSPEERVETLMERLNWPMSDAQMERIHNQINDVFFIRFFELLSQGDLPQITAYQVRQMMGEKAVLMSSISESFEEDYLNGAVDAQWAYETKAGRMPKAPDILYDPEYSNGKIDVNYIGPLAQLQKSLLKSKGIIDGLEVIKLIQSIWPQSVIKINEMQLIEEAGIAQGMQQSLFKSDDEIGAILAEQRQKDEQAAMVEQGAQVAKALPAAGQEIQPNSPLALLGV